MKKIIVFSFSFMLILFLPLQNGVCEMPQWDSACSFLYGINIRKIDGTALPPAPLEVSDLENGLTVEISNGSPLPDRYMLLCVSNGHLLPFTINGDTQNFFTNDIDGSETQIQKIYLGEFPIIDSTIQYLHIVVIGCQKQLSPKTTEFYSDFFVAVTLSFTVETLPTYSLTVEPFVYELNKYDVNVANGINCVVDFVQSDTQFSSSLSLMTIQSTISYDTAIAAAVNGFNQLMQLVVVIDSIPITSMDSTIPCLNAPEGKLVLSPIDTASLSPGDHTLFAIAIPLLNHWQYSTSTPFTVIHIQ